MIYKDSYIRTFSKTMTYRVLSSLTMIILGMFLLDQNLYTAFWLMIPLSINGIWLFYLHEFIWNHISFKRDGYDEHQYRSLAKTITWRIQGIITIFLTTWIFTSASVQQSSFYSLILGFVLMGVHYIHERVWTKIKWQKNI